MRPPDVATFSARFPQVVGGLTPSDVEALLQVLVLHTFEAGEALIVEQTTSNALYLVWDGELDVCMETPAGTCEVAQVGEGALLGEISLLDPGPATATVRTKEGCTVLYISRDRLEQLWDAHPRVATAFMRAISREVAKRIRSATAYLHTLRGDDAPRPAARPVQAVIAAHSKLYASEG